jgi:dipeptidase E
MGLIDALGVTHFHAEGREEDFKRMVAKHSGMGIAIDNNCAIEFIDGSYRVITSQPGGRAYRVYKKQGEVVTEQLAQKQEMTPVSQLLQK